MNEYSFPSATYNRTSSQHLGCEQILESRFFTSLRVVTDSSNKSPTFLRASQTMSKRPTRLNLVAVGNEFLVYGVHPYASRASADLLVT